MPEILLGTLVLVAVLFLGQLLSGADLRIFARRLRRLGGGAFMLVALAAAAVDRVGIAMVFAGLGWMLFTGGQIFPTSWSGFRWRAAGHGQRQGGRPRRLEVEVDPRTGKMRGRVRAGRFAGQSLDEMDLWTLVALQQEIDEQSARLLQAYIKERFGSREHGRATNDAAGGLTMSRAEAYAVLGLEAGASPERIRAAHRRLMLQNHPDRGGSHHLATRINQAKDVLLG